MMGIEHKHGLGCWFTGEPLETPKTREEIQKERHLKEYTEEDLINELLRRSELKNKDM
jgi:hypothetical protein